MKIIRIAILLYSTTTFAQTSTVTVKKNSQVTSVTSDTGKPHQIRIICAPSKNSVKPLYVINGTVMQDSILASINPSQIESINVVKNASAVEKYGS